MPELPEVETSRRGLLPMLHQPVNQVIVRQARLRWPIPDNLAELVVGYCFNQLNRRGKYLLAQINQGWLIMHLGMSGHFRLLSEWQPPQKHDHLDILFNDGRLLRYHDPRRFGCILYSDNPEQHPLLAQLGPEPLTSAFNADYLYQHLRGRQSAIKKRLMDSHLVVGVGNIYANEALFIAGIHPERTGDSLSWHECELLVDAVQVRLRRSIDQGGTTLRDFLATDGKPGYFRQELQVYERALAACYRCGGEIQQLKQDNRSSYFCPHCQK